MRDDEREMLRDSLVRLLAETDPVKLPAALDEFGWGNLLASEPGEAVAALFETQGEQLRPSPMLNVVMAAPLFADCVVVLPGPGAGAEPRSSLSRRGLHVDGYCLAAEVSRLVVAGRRDGELVIAQADGSLVCRPVDGVDPWLELTHLQGVLQPVHVLTGLEASRAWDTAVAAGRRALAHELVGVSRAMLALAVDHVTTRRQFGRLIGSFQAVKHRLAEAQVALTAAEAAATEAWAEADPLSALLAKLWAGRAARTVARQTQQVLGGMGFTWEHAFHRHFRRTLVLDSLLGSTTELQLELGRRLLASGELPRLATL